jgi:hypothetical protein
VQIAPFCVTSFSSHLSMFLSLHCHYANLQLHVTIVTNSTTVLFEKLSHLWTPKVYYRVHKIQQIVPIQSQTSPFHIPTLSFEIYFNIIFQSTPRSVKRSLPLRSSHWNFVRKLCPFTVSKEINTCDCRYTRFRYPRLYFCTMRSSNVLLTIEL